jgi:hypothetical protein
MVRFRVQLDHIRLAGMGSVPCLLIGGDGADALPALQALWAAASAECLVGQVLCASGEAYEIAASRTPRDTCVVVSPREVAHVLGPSGGVEDLKGIIRRHVGRKRLVPYSITLPARGGMFFGREEDLEYLISGRDNTALVGPGFIGKTSLLQRVREVLLRSRDRQASNYVYYSFRPAPPATMDESARAIAMAVHGGSQADRVGTAGLPGFLDYCRRNVFRGLVTLILDEVDDTLEADRVRGYPLLEALREASSQRRAIRLVIGGRGALHRVLNDPNMPLVGRIRTRSLGPLGTDAARDLLSLPCRDLGLNIVDSDAVLAHVTSMAGWLPHLLQYYGSELALLAIDRETQAVSMEHVHTFENQPETSRFFAGIVTSIKDPHPRLIALLLLRQNPRAWTIPEVQALIGHASLRMTLDETKEVCDELVIRNVLLWERGTYRVANDALRHFLAEGQLLDSLLAECKSFLRSTVEEARLPLPRSL